MRDYCTSFNHKHNQNSIKSFTKQEIIEDMVAIWQSCKLLVGLNLNSSRCNNPRFKNKKFDTKIYSLYTRIKNSTQEIQEWCSQNEADRLGFIACDVYGQADKRYVYMRTEFCVMYGCEKTHNTQNKALEQGISSTKVMHVWTQRYDFLLSSLL